MYRHSVAGVALPFALMLSALSACGDKTATPAPTASGVARVETAATPERDAAPAPAAAVIQTQPGPGGSVVALNKVKVTGDVLTVQLTFTGKPSVPVLKLDEINLIDDKTSQRIGMLKDNAGKYMASPVSSNGENLQINLYESPAVVWFKFPAPPATSPTVSLNIPEVAPFDGVPVAR